MFFETEAVSGLAPKCDPVLDASLTRPRPESQPTSRSSERDTLGSPLGLGLANRRSLSNDVDFKMLLPLVMDSSRSPVPFPCPLSNGMLLYIEQGEKINEGMGDVKNGVAS